MKRLLPIRQWLAFLATGLTQLVWVSDGWCGDERADRAARLETSKLRVVIANNEACALIAEMSHRQHED